MAKKVRVTVDLKPEEYQELLDLKFRLDRPLAWLGRRAICEFLEKHRNLQYRPSSEPLTWVSERKGKTE
jgi:hypothetical protein